MKVEEISKETADKIFMKQFGNNLLSDLKGILGSKTYTKVFNWFNFNEINNTSNIDFKRVVIKKNHFTLDHVLPKNEFPFLSLSIFNLVPSCYSCNSKFKHQKEFTINDDLVKFCPTSDDFILDNLIRFKMKFDINDIEFDRKIKNIRQIDDIKINVENVKSFLGVDEFVEIFKIDSRYEFHKNIALDLIEKRKMYPDSQINEIEKLFRNNGISISKNTFKKQIFGSLIFEKKSANEPFEKYKKDIAKQLGIIK